MYLKAPELLSSLGKNLDDRNSDNYILITPCTQKNENPELLVQSLPKHMANLLQVVIIIMYLCQFVKSLCIRCKR